MGMLLSEKDGTIKLAEYLDDQKMHALYERFILEYFKKEHPELKTSRDKVAWNLDEASNSIIDLLPEMQTDITIRYKEKTLIIDAKYYGEILKKGRYGGTGKIYSPNMYQIYSYVKNMDKNHTGNVEGMLLYAGTDEPVKDMRDVSMDGNKFHVRTLDLSGEWSEIKSTLDEVASDFKGAGST
jgi:5-methylcytosine-specific restriction enzyme subunit McrC